MGSEGYIFVEIRGVLWKCGRVVVLYVRLLSRFVEGGWPNVLLHWLAWGWWRNGDVEVGYIAQAIQLWCDLGFVADDDDG
jgi:hypothetical protein